MTLVYQDSGFVFMVKKNDIDGRLPQGFINVAMQKGRWLFSSLELASQLIAVVSALNLYLISEEAQCQNEGRS
jgi:DNA mismatch repair protein MSH4